jgi:thioredoxin 1
MPAVHLTDADFNDTVLKSDKPVLVDFFATWCGPCKMAAPVIDELADQYDGKAVVVKVDVDENQATASAYGVMSIPTMVLFKDGKEVERKVGFGGRSAVETMIESAMK